MTTEEKDIYAIGEIPPLGYMPKKMHAWVIRRDPVSYTHLTLPTTPYV